MDTFTEKEVQQMFADIALTFIMSEETDAPHAGVLGLTMGKVITESMGEDAKDEYITLVANSLLNAPVYS